MTSEELSTDAIKNLTANRRREKALKNGDYELQPGEGFYCENCGHHSTWATMDEEFFEGDMEIMMVCTECGNPVDEGDSETDWLEPWEPTEEEIEEAEGSEDLLSDFDIPEWEDEDE